MADKGIKIIANKLNEKQISNEKEMLANLDKDKEIKKLKELCNKYEEEHNTTFEEWKKTINIINKLEKYIKNNKVAIGIKKDSNYAIPVEYVLDKLQELKGSDKE